MTSDTDRRSVYLAAFTMMAWGLAGTFVRLLVPHFSATGKTISMAILGGRLFLALFALIVALVIFAGRALRETILPALIRRETWTCAAFQFIYYLLAVIAFTLAPIGEIAICASTAPLWVLLLRRLRGQSVTSNEVIGATVALCGVAVIVLPNLMKHPVAGVTNAFPYRVVGDSLSLCSAIVTGIYALFQRRFTLRGIAVDPRALSLATFALGSPLALFLLPVPPSILFAPQTIGIFSGLAVLSTVLPTLAFAAASRHLPPVTTATLALLLPVFATTYAAIFLREMPSFWLIPGGGLVLFGLWNILRPKKGNAV